MKNGDVLMKKDVVGLKEQTNLEILSSSAINMILMNK